VSAARFTRAPIRLFARILGLLLDYRALLRQGFARLADAKRTAVDVIICKRLSNAVAARELRWEISERLELRSEDLRAPHMKVVSRTSDSSVAGLGLRSSRSRRVQLENWRSTTR